MKQQGYDFKISKDSSTFTFYSEGPKGRIKKKVKFKPYYYGGKTLFNIGISDWNIKSRKYDDNTVTNNNDKNEILFTLTLIVLEFTKRFPDTWVHGKGRTQARNRLFQMTIKKHWDKIENNFKILGCREEHWETFNFKNNYEAFIA